MDNHLLVILPHPDDESFGVAGTMLSYKEKGWKITYACMTLGDMGRNMGNPPIANRETLSQIRKKELEDAAKILKIDDLILLGLRDKTIEFENEDKLSARIRKLIEDCQPTLVITFYPGYSIHPDHDACGAVVMKAIASMPKENRPTVHALAISRESIADLGEPQIVNDVKSYSQQKLDALKAHKTQMQEVVRQTELALQEGNDEAIDRLNYERFWLYSFE
ncbi:bacillithiol biosynthesis deacetylase BshB2 [Alkalihalobacterium elongatum]|uniref:bacillithiol biosynthesis deacetylase BshB2 n=1 Tax=Alkalihalobacterium elongatum TaxID=2675466 RepID=UPI001C1F57D7|nr:bacillithiol biosynthesis deacetylase BshB2 [Alkalihalobacterium elongatum]